MVKKKLDGAVDKSLADQEIQRNRVLQQAGRLVVSLATEV